MLVFAFAIGVLFAISGEYGGISYPWYVSFFVHALIGCIWVCLWLTLKRLLVDEIGYDAIRPVITLCIGATFIGLILTTFETWSADNFLYTSGQRNVMAKGLATLVFGIYFYLGWKLLECPHALFGMKKRYGWSMVVQSVLMITITWWPTYNNSLVEVIHALVAVGMAVMHILATVFLYQLFSRWANSASIFPVDPIDKLIDEIGE